MIVEPAIIAKTLLAPEGSTPKTNGKSPNFVPMARSNATKTNAKTTPQTAKSVGKNHSVEVNLLRKLVDLFILIQPLTNTKEHEKATHKIKDQAVPFVIFLFCAFSCLFAAKIIIS